MRVEVDAGEVDLLQPLAGDRHRVRDDVHGAGDDVGDPLRVGDRLELHLARVRVAEDGLGHRPDHVDVEALDLPGERVEEAEVVGALVHPGDEVAAGADLRHERAWRHLRRPGRAQAARLRVACARGGGRAHRPWPPGRRAGWPGAAAAAAVPSASPDAASTTSSARRQGARPRVHRYSASRRLRPQAQPATITSAATIMPTARPGERVPAAAGAGGEDGLTGADPLGEGRGQPREAGGGVAGQRGLHRAGVVSGVVLRPQGRVRLVPGPGLRHGVASGPPLAAEACTAASSVPGPGPRSFCWAT